MKVLLSCLLLLLAACSTPIPTTYVEPFLKDNVLTGNSVAGAGWVLNDGVIEANATEDMTFLTTDAVYDNFILTLEFYPVGGVNSGIFIRCLPGEEVSATNCYEINIYDDHPNQDNRTGAIPRRALPLEKIFTVDQWNTCEIIADDNEISVRMNNVVTAVYEGDELSSGYIALQRAVADTIRFRNIRLEPLD